MKNKVMIAGALGATGLSAMAQSSGPSTLPVDPSFLYTCINSPTVAAVGVALGFGGLFMVIGYIKKALSKK
jgi:hypothetical protein